MIIKSIELHNWQSYRGVGADAARFDFLNAETGQQNAIIYGQNTQGKTAFWQAFRFALYGKVKAVNSANAGYKPWVSTQTEDQPLMNVYAFRENGPFKFGVVMEFVHGGEEYTLERIYKWNKLDTQKRPNSQREFKPNLIIHAKTRSEYVSKPQSFINTILPEELSNFFMFDGERLEEYKRLMSEHAEVELKSNIEKILRLPILRQGIDDLDELIGNLAKEIGKEERKKKSSSQDKQKLDALNKEIEGYRRNHEKALNHVEALSRARDEVHQWLEAQGTTQQRLAEEKRYEKDIKEAKEREQLGRELFKRSLRDAWRVILNTAVAERADVIQRALDEQEKLRPQIALARDELNSLAALRDGGKCKHCHQDIPPPSSEKRAEIEEKRSKLSEQIAKWEHGVTTPDPETERQRVRKLRTFTSDANLSAISHAEKSIASAVIKRRDSERDLDKVKDLLSDDKKLEVAEKARRRHELDKKIAEYTQAAEKYKRAIAVQQPKQQRLSVKLRAIEGDSKKLTKLRLKHSYAEALQDELSAVLEAQRELMRSTVEEKATETFKKCSSASHRYKLLRIYEKFNVSLIGIDGEPNAGSMGQWMIIAYSLLDALTQCSGIEFPMVIDTPGRSLDDENTSAIFDYLFSCGRQVILLPQHQELKPEAGDKKYGRSCAHTYLIAHDGSKTNVKKRL